MTYWETQWEGDRDQAGESDADGFEAEGDEDDEDDV